MLWELPGHHLVFPHPLTADSEGPLAIGGWLTPAHILLAYQYGIFPWYSEEDPLLWWYTNPRSVLFPDQIYLSKSMKKVLRDATWKVTFDQAFSEVITACQHKTRKNQDSTWIQSEIIDAYSELHQLGYAHSVEVWENSKLIAGLYGLSIGHIFYGESMFTHQSNASKYALIHLAQHLHQKGYTLIDCQQETDHLNSMGAQCISAESFLDHLRRNVLFCLQHGDHHF